jgi:hypothetical protein
LQFVPIDDGGSNLSKCVKIKSFFGRKFLQEVDEHDGIKGRLADAEERLVNNQLCEQELMGEVYPGEEATTNLLKDAELNFFRGHNVKLLKAFIKARLLDDVTNTSLDENMPKKGVLAGSQKP